MARILLVDDDPSVRQLLVQLLASEGHQLLEAHDGAEGLQLVRVGAVDLVVSDILMPTMNGLEFVQRLRADPAYARTPVIFSPQAIWLLR